MSIWTPSLLKQYGELRTVYDHERYNYIMHKYKKAAERMNAQIDREY